MELTPDFLRGLAGELALECRAKDVAISQLEQQMAAAQTENRTLRSKVNTLRRRLAELAPDLPPAPHDHADGREG